ncbi:MAG: nucleotidyl transferase AbiEii/AbiGii toxin family protein [Eubacterium sp.]|nr:nucleotidyl transferase AbiEii/AbiGii toxin family protein [Eubacterium sp.]
MEYLHNNKNVFNDIVLNASEYLNIEPAIIEKDYYVTLLLKEIVSSNPDIIFKGGTSLSKCFQIVNRFSEDLDIGLNVDKATEGMRRGLKRCIVAAIEKYGFTLGNEDSIYSKRDFNRYQIKYPITQEVDYIKPFLFVETAVFLKPFPFETRQADTYIYRFLAQNGYDEIIGKYKLETFDVNVQSLDRTFIDKLFALGDYYLTNKVFGYSRHLYDLYKIAPEIVYDDDFYRLFDEVREIRALDKDCPSAKPENSLKKILKEICDKDFFKSDYEDVTEELLFETVSYNTIKQNLIEIINSIR